MARVSLTSRVGLRRRHATASCACLSNYRWYLKFLLLHVFVRAGGVACTVRACMLCSIKGPWPLPLCVDKFCSIICSSTRLACSRSFLLCASCTPPSFSSRLTPDTKALGPSAPAHRATVQQQHSAAWSTAHHVLLRWSNHSPAHPLAARHLAASPTCDRRRCTSAAKTFLALAKCSACRPRVVPSCQCLPLLQHVHMLLCAALDHSRPEFPVPTPADSHAPSPLSFCHSLPLGTSCWCLDRSSASLISVASSWSLRVLHSVSSSRTR